MITVLSQKYPGSLLFCQECHALLAFKAADLYEGKYIYCPVCRAKNETKIVDGVIKNDSSSN